VPCIRPSPDWCTNGRMSQLTEANRAGHPLGLDWSGCVKITIFFIPNGGRSLTSSPKEIERVPHELFWRNWRCSFLFCFLVVLRRRTPPPLRFPSTFSLSACLAGCSPASLCRDWGSVIQDPGLGVAREVWGFRGLQCSCCRQASVVRASLHNRLRPCRSGVQ
jgi:hypothetical protein